MRPFLLPLVFFLACINVPPARLDADETAHRLPAAWHGDWKGTLRVTPARGKVEEAPMELHVRPREDGKGLTWQVVYGGGEKRQLRDYELAAVAGEPGHFLLD